jgi:membrane protease subunit HflC
LTATYSPRGIGQTASGDIVSLNHSHAHAHGHAHHRRDGDAHGHGGAATGGPGFYWRVALAALCVVIAFAVASFIQVQAGQATVVTRFGEPVRVLLDPGLAWRLPAPIEAAVPVDLRLHTTSSGLQDVGTRDGLRIIVQAYVAWRVPANASDVGRFVRAVRNEPDEAARQIRSLLGSALQTTSADFDLASLVNTNPGQVRIAAFEDELRRQVDSQLYQAYGVHVVQVGLEQLTLPAVLRNAPRMANGKPRRSVPMRIAMRALPLPMPTSRLRRSRHSRARTRRRSTARVMRATRISIRCCVRSIR